jgi:hypothetical protein
MGLGDRMDPLDDALEDGLAESPLIDIVQDCEAGRLRDVEKPNMARSPLLLELGHAYCRYLKVTYMKLSNETLAFLFTVTVSNENFDIFIQMLNHPKE